MPKNFVRNLKISIFAKVLRRLSFDHPSGWSSQNIINKNNMQYTDIYRSAYLKAEDLSGRTAKHTISGCTAEKVGDDERLVLAFSENDRPLVLNKTNATTLAELYGPETGDWEGKAIKLVPSTTSFQGKMVKCIRISPEQVANDV